MGKFSPTYISRSDGMLETVTKHGGRITKEPNQPTAKQLDDKPKADGVKDYYREVAIDESKHMDWRRKLGFMLARDLNLPQGTLMRRWMNHLQETDALSRKGIHPRPLPAKLPTIRARQDSKERRW